MGRGTSGGRLNRNRDLALMEIDALEERFFFSKNISTVIVLKERLLSKKVKKINIQRLLGS